MLEIYGDILMTDKDATSVTKTQKELNTKILKRKEHRKFGVALVASFYAISVTKIQKELNTKILKRKEHRKFGAKLKRS